MRVIAILRVARPTLAAFAAMGPAALALTMGFARGWGRDLRRALKRIAFDANQTQML